MSKTEHISNSTDHIDSMSSRWPSTIVARSEISTFTGGAFSPGTMANLDCYGKGPKDRFILGRETVYPVNSLVEWLKSRVTILEKKTNAQEAEYREASHVN